MLDEGLSQVLEIAPVVPPVKMPRPPVPYLGPEFSYCSDLSESAQLPYRIQGHFKSFWHYDAIKTLTTLPSLASE